jgi:ribonuclease T2
MNKLALGLLALLGAALATPALALDDGCLLDKCADQAKPDQSPAVTDTKPSARYGGPAPAGSFDFYVLALSWSPGFCESHDGAGAQCEPGSKRGFVVHGLWPQYEHGFPANCGGSPTVSRIALDRVKGLYPDEGLARHEWRKHGVCTGLSPADYFDQVARARALVTIPTSFENAASEETVPTLNIERAFTESNPRLRPGMLSVACDRGMLQEVRICLTRDLREFRACPEVARRGCHSREIRVPAPY